MDRWWDRQEDGSEGEELTGLEENEANQRGDGATEPSGSARAQPRSTRVYPRQSCEPPLFLHCEIEEGQISLSLLLLLLLPSASALLRSPSLHPSRCSAVAVAHSELSSVPLLPPPPRWVLFPMTSKLDQSLGEIITSTRTAGAARGRKETEASTLPPSVEAANGSSTSSPSPSSHPLSRQSDAPPPSSSSSASSSGPVRRERGRQRSSPYSTSSRAGDGGERRWNRDLYQQYPPPLPHNPTTALPLPQSPALSLPLLSPPPSSFPRVVGTTVAVSNLHSDVTAEDLRDIFSPLGSIRHCQVHYDRSGRSLGTAQVEYKRAEDAEKAVVEFDRAEVDGREMRIQLMGTVVAHNTAGHGGGSVGPPIHPLMLQGMLQLGAMGMGLGGAVPAGGRNRGEGRQNERGEGGRGGREKGKGGNGRGEGKAEGREREGRTKEGQGRREGGRGKGRKEKGPVKAEDLDAEMDSYHTAAVRVAPPSTGPVTAEASSVPVEAAAE